MEFELIEEPIEIELIDILCCAYDYYPYSIDPDVDEEW